jgi:pimeloyl-ACP methyl ester carboxylesterase
MSDRPGPVSASFRRAPHPDGKVPEPFFFDADGRQLFGCHHWPQFKPTRDLGVILCYPIGHEHVLSHRAYKQLAQRFSSAGFHALRFDYTGCGDSGGDSNEWSFARWLEDIASAIEEFSHRCGLEKICLVGCRLGATLALAAGSVCRDINSTVLWDPVVSGAGYLHQLKSEHRRMLMRSHVMPERGRAAEFGDEILGFHLPAALSVELESLTPYNLRQSSAQSVFVVESKEQSEAQPLIAHLQNTGAKVTHEVVPCSMVWDWSESLSKVLVPVQILRAIVAWLEKEYP